MENENKFAFRQNIGKRNILGGIKNFLRHNNKLVIVVIIVLALTLPFIVNQVLKQQDLRERAASFPPLTFSFQPIAGTFTPGVSEQVSFNLTTDINDVGSVTVEMTYDPTIVSVTDISYPTPLQAFSKTNSIGKFTATLLNPTNTKVTGSNLTIITFTVVGLKTGSTSLKVSSIKATVSGSDQYAVINDPTNIKTDFIVNDQVSPSGGTPAVTGTVTPSTPIPTTDVCIAPTGLWPNGCACTNDTQCLGGKCKPDANGGGTCTDYLSPTPTNTPTVTPIIPTATPTTPIPTATYAPTATPIPNDTTIGIVFQLPGIGNGPLNLGLNPTPINPQREAVIQILDGTNTVVKNVNTNLRYSSGTSSFLGLVSLGPDFSTDSYTVKVKVDNSLVKLIPGIFKITQGQTTSRTSVVTLVTGDLNNDNTLGVIDWTLMMSCIKNESACTPDIRKLADLNDNGGVDEYDVQILQRGFAVRDGD